jgi:hypothetical protein
MRCPVCHLEKPDILTVRIEGGTTTRFSTVLTGCAECRKSRELYFHRLVDPKKPLDKRTPEAYIEH